MNRSFHQARGLLRIEAQLEPDGVLYRERALLRSIERKVRFEELGDDVTRVFHVSRLYLLVCLFFGVGLVFRGYNFVLGNDVSVLQLVASVLYFALPVAGTWMTSPRLIGYPASGGGVLFFEHGRPDALAFLQDLREAKQAYLRGRYAQATGEDLDPARTPDAQLLN